MKLINNAETTAKVEQTENKSDIKFTFKKETSGGIIFEVISDKSAKINLQRAFYDAKGNIVFYTSIVYYHTPLDLLNNNTLDWVYYIDKELDPKLVEYGKNAVKAFGMKERFFHI